MTTNIERAAEVIEGWVARGYGYPEDNAESAAQALADAGLLMPDEDERMPSWVYDHPDVCTNPHRMGGVPCIRGTRIPVHIVLEWIEHAPDADIREFYPDITADVITRLRTAREEHNDV